MHKFLEIRVCRSHARVGLWQVALLRHTHYSLTVLR